MFAIIEDGSHQYRVEPGQSLTVDYRKEASEGDTIEFDRVLLANGGGASAVGRPTIEGATVTTEVVTPELKGIERVSVRMAKRARPQAGTGIMAGSLVIVVVIFLWYAAEKQRQQRSDELREFMREFELPQEPK